jgi:hypothetical protein
LKKHMLKNIVAVPFVVVLLIVTAALSGAAYAELVDNGGELIYDTDRDITWYVPDVEPMTWSEAVSWAAGLSVSSVTGWRLPSMLNEDGTGPCNSYNCVGSEFGHLYYVELGNAPGGPITNRGPFSNLKDGVYWSALQWQPYPGNAWAFDVHTGLQGFADKNLYANFYPMAVHDGDVGGSARSRRTPKHGNMKGPAAHSH